MPGVLCNIEGGVTGLSLENRCSSAVRVLSEPASLGIPCFVVPMEMVFLDFSQTPLSDCNDKELYVHKG